MATRKKVRARGAGGAINPQALGGFGKLARLFRINWRDAGLKQILLTQLTNSQR